MNVIYFLGTYNLWNINIPKKITYTIIKKLLSCI